MTDPVSAVGSSGTLVGAALQTVGVFYQSDVLDFMAGPFSGSIPALIFIVAVLSAVIFFALNNNYKAGLWFFIGPALFSAVVFTRVEVDAVDWKFGEQYRDASAVADIAGIDTTAAPARVSSLYAWYDRLVSSITRSIEAALAAAGREEADQRFLNWAALYGATAAAGADDSGFRSLLHSALAGQCGQVMRLSRTMFDPTVDYARRCTAAFQYQEIMGDCTSTSDVDCSSGIRVNLNASSRDYAARLYHSSDGLFNNDLLLTTNPTCSQNAMITRCGTMYSGYISSVIAGGEAHPTEIPQGVQRTAQDGEAEVDFLNTVINTCRGATADAARNTYMGELCTEHIAASNAIRSVSPEATLSELIAARRPSPDRVAAVNQRAAEPKSCYQVWGLVYAGLIREGMANYDRVNRAQFESGMQSAPSGICEESFTPEDVAGEMSELFQAGGTGDPSEVVRAISRHILSNEIQKSRLGSMIEDWADTSTSLGGIGFEGESEVESVERARVEGREWQEQTRLMYTAGSLPYYQGLGLYFLTFLFPFWALMLIIPGRHATFLLWFQYYAWLKSWDIGFAIVMVLDEFLSALFMADLDQYPNGLAEDMNLALNAIQGLDPSFHISQYYSIIATSLMSIPILMSYIMLGGVTRGAQMVAEGINKVAGTNMPGLGGRGFAGFSGYAQRDTRASQAITESQALQAGYASLAARNPVERGRFFSQAAAGSSIASPMTSTFQAFDQTLRADDGFGWLFDIMKKAEDSLDIVNSTASTQHQRADAGESFLNSAEDLFITGLIVETGAEAVQGFQTALKTDGDRAYDRLARDISRRTGVDNVTGDAIREWAKRQGGVGKAVQNVTYMVESAPGAAKDVLKVARDQYLYSIEVITQVAASEALTSDPVIASIQRSSLFGTMPLPVSMDRPITEQTNRMIGIYQNRAQAVARILSGR